MKSKAILISLGVPDRLKIIRDILSKEYDVRIYISDFSHAKKEYIKNKDPECNYIHVLNYKKNISIKRILSYIFFAKSISKILKNEHPKLIYVMLPPNIIANKCKEYKLKHSNVILIVDVYDLWPESLPIKYVKKHAAFLLSIWKKVRTSVLKKSDYIFTECNYYRKVIGADVLPENKTSVLYIHKEQSPQVRELVLSSIENYHLKKNTLCFGYLGGINNIIDIKNITEAMEQLVSYGYAITVKIIGDGESRKEFIDSLKKVGANVEYFGIIFDNKRKARILCECDYALNMMVDDIIVGLTTKSVDYLSLGIPLFNNIKEDTWDLVEKEQIGVNYSGNIENLIKNLSEEKIKQEKKNALEYFDNFLTSSSLKNHARNEFIKHGIINKW